MRGREWIIRVFTLLPLGVFLFLWILSPTFSEDATTDLLTRSILFRSLGALIFLCLLLSLGYRQWRLPPASSLLVFLPALVISVNNLPIWELVTGEAWLVRSDLLWLYALESLCIGVFEEFAFRGTLFLWALERFGSTRRSIVLTTVLSSAVFGLIHLVNLAEGAGILPTLLQVGYSFLIGGMCSIVLLKTHNLLTCVFLHTVYDFCGGLLQTLGDGVWPTAPTVVITVILSLLVTAWMLTVLFRVTPEEVGSFFERKKKE